MTKTYSGLVNLNGNLMAAIDYETTGRRPGYHEIIQIAIVPLDSDLLPSKVVRPFYTTIRPEFPERSERTAERVHGLSINELVLHAPESGRVQDQLLEWNEKLELPFKKVLVPLAHNWAFESAFTKAWLGVDLADQVFHSHARDSMLLALSMNDRAAFQGEPALFNHVSLTAMARQLGVHNPRAHDAYCDAVAEAEVYKLLLQTF